MRRRLFTALARASIGFVVFAALAAATTWAYYRFMPASWFLNYYSAHADNAVIGEPVSLTLCRTTHYKNFRIEATRTFVFQQRGDGFEPVAEYNFGAQIEQQETPCQTIQIPVTRQPQMAGTYRIKTEATFQVAGNRKTVAYETNTYTISDTADSIEAQIKQLKAKIDELEARYQALINATRADETSGSQSGSSSSSGSSRSSSTTTTRTATPTKQSRPAQQSQQPATPPTQPSLMQQVIRRVFGPFGIPL